MKLDTMDGLAVFLAVAEAKNFRVAGERDADLAGVVDLLEEEGTTSVYASYWTAMPLEFEAGDRLTVGSMDVHRLLASVRGLPFVKAAGWDEAAAALEGGAEGGLVGRRLGPGVSRTGSRSGRFVRMFITIVLRVVIVPRRPALVERRPMRPARHAHRRAGYDAVGAAPPVPPARAYRG